MSWLDFLTHDLRDRGEEPVPVAFFIPNEDENADISRSESYVQGGRGLLGGSRSKRAAHNPSLKMSGYQRSMQPTISQEYISKTSLCTTQLPLYHNVEENYTEVRRSRLVQANRKNQFLFAFVHKDSDFFRDSFLGTPLTTIPISIKLGENTLSKQSLPTKIKILYSSTAAIIVFPLLRREVLEPQILKNISLVFRLQTRCGGDDYILPIPFSPCGFVQPMIR